MTIDVPWTVVPEVVPPDQCAHIIAKGPISGLYNTLSCAAVALPLMVHITGWKQLQVNHYVANSEGPEYRWHADNEWLPDEIVKVTVIVPLNDTFQGGGTQIMWPTPDKIVRPNVSIGDALVFPSPMFHRAAPITEGERYALVGWAVGPRYQ